MLLMRESTVQDYARRGVLPSFKIGRHRRFLRSDVLAASTSCAIRAEQTDGHRLRERVWYPFGIPAPDPASPANPLLLRFADLQGLREG
jgi:Helix-turn-helix domain